MLAGAFKLPWEQRKPLAHAVCIPLLSLIGVSLVSEFELITLPEAFEWLWMFIYVVPTAWLAVYIHRFLLRDLSDARTGVESGNAKRVVLYALLVLGFWALVMGVTIFGVLEMPASDTGDLIAHMVQTLVLLVVCLVVSALIGGRFCLALPAIAVGAGVRAAVRAARGNTLRLTMVFAWLPVALTVLIELLIGEDAGIFDLTLLVVLGATVTIVEVAALSLSYRELTQPAPPPTDPPA